MDNLLREKYQPNVEQEKLILTKIVENEKSFINFLVFINRFFATHAVYIKKDINKSKQFFSNAAQISLYTIQKYDAPFYSNIYAICFAIISDDEKIINEFSKITKENKTQIMGRLFVQNFQNALNDNYDEQEIENLKRLLLKKPQGFQGLDDFFFGLQDKDLSKVQQSLNLLISNHGKRGELELYRDYISFEVTALSKLAWRKGIEVEVNSPLVPKELLPIQPLEHYEIPYDFLK